MYQGLYGVHTGIIHTSILPQLTSGAGCTRGSTTSAPCRTPHLHINNLHPAAVDFWGGVYQGLYDVGPVSYSNPTSVLQQYLSWGNPPGTDPLGANLNNLGISRILAFNQTYMELAAEYYAADK